MSAIQRTHTHKVLVGSAPGNVIAIGGGSPIVVQSMTNTDTTDIAATANQIIALAGAGSEMVRITVNTPDAASAVSQIVARVRDAGCLAPVIGDFHYNGHLLLTEYPDCARALDKYRINPGNVGAGKKRDTMFGTICHVAAANGKPVRIGVNMGSLDPMLVAAKMHANTEQHLGKTSEAVMNECMILSALDSTALALECGLREDQIVISCKCSTPTDLIALYRELATRTQQPLHLGLTEAGLGVKGLVWSSAAMAVLLEEGIGDTIRVSLTPRPDGDRCEEVYASCELLQALGLRAFAPTITSCPGCGRTTSTTFQSLAVQTEDFVRAHMGEWRRRYVGVETLKLAVMGCIVNGPGESKAANIGISLPGTDEDPHCPVFVDGVRAATLSGSGQELAVAFHRIIEEYVAAHYAPRKV